MANPTDATGQDKPPANTPPSTRPPGDKPGRVGRIRALLRERDAVSLRHIALLILALVAVSAVFWLSANLIGLDENGILSSTFKSFAGSPWALPVVAACFTVASFIGAPQFLLIAVTVAVFGPLQGFIFSILSTLVSSSVNFLVARHLGTDWLNRLGWQGIGGFSEMVERNGFMTALLVRIIPSAPFVVLNMGFGLTRTSYIAFISGTAVGILPKTTLIALLGKVVERAQSGDSLSIFYLVLAALGWIALAFIAKWIVRRREARRQQTAG
ncbi:MAG: VTT domain-containing protein [Alphaproteobacteria bacterium]|nr:VTT domain-containing protein [Alphaproteobacteria bacterium]